MENKDRTLEKGYQKYIKYCTIYRIEYGYNPKQDMILDEDGHRVYYFDEFKSRLERDVQFRNKFVDSEIKPIPITLRKWDEMEQIAKSIVDKVQDGTYHEDNDDAYYMYEVAMTAIYGDEFWDWFNGNTP